MREVESRWGRARTWGPSTTSPPSRSAVTKALVPFSVAAWTTTSGHVPRPPARVVHPGWRLRRPAEQSTPPPHAAAGCAVAVRRGCRWLMAPRRPDGLPCRCDRAVRRIQQVPGVPGGASPAAPQAVRRYRACRHAAPSARDMPRRGAASDVWWRRAGRKPRSPSPRAASSDDEAVTALTRGRQAMIQPPTVDNPNGAGLPVIVLGHGQR